MKTIKVSVVVTAYNHENYITQCLESILIQKGAFDLEVILGDDCSTDRTRQIMQEYTEKHPDIFVLLPPAANIGVTRNIKRCLDACSGNYIAFCEGDDYWIDRYKLQKQLEFLESHPGYSLCFNAIILYYENEEKYVPHAGQLMLNKDTLTIKDLIKTNFIGNFSCCMYRTDTVRKLPDELFDIYTWDWMFNMACSRLGKIGFIRDWMSVYRIRPHGAWSGKSHADQRQIMVAAIDSYNQFFNYEYHKQFCKLKNKLAVQYGENFNQEAPFWEKYGGLLILAIKHPRKACNRLLSALSVAFAELTTAAVSVKDAQIAVKDAQIAVKIVVRDAQIAELSSAVQTRDVQLAELSSSVQAKDAQIAKLTSAIFANIEAAPALSRKLHVGCGNVKLLGWLNIDVEPSADLVIDVREGLPFGDNNIDFIYNEHFFEHLTYEESEKVLREFWRCLKKGGVLRIATPDLDFLIQVYDRDFKNQDWFPAGFEFVKTKGRAINMAFRWWGHQYLYNEEELTDQLIKVGFQNIRRCELNKSNYPELSNSETRKESTLILEAVKE